MIPSPEVLITPIPIKLTSSSGGILMVMLNFIHGTAVPGQASALHLHQPNMLKTLQVLTKMDGSRCEYSKAQ